MTGPNTFQYPSYYPGPDQEWGTFLKRRSELLDDINTRFQLNDFLTKQDPGLALNIGAGRAAADSLANTHQVQGQNADGSPTKFQFSRTEPTHEETNQLLGAAQFWGIDNADKIPPKALRNIIEARRLSAASEGRGDLNPLADVGLTALAAVGLGTTQGLIGIAQKIPFIGHAVAENHYTQEASQWLSSVNEGVQAGMSEDERSGYRIAHGLGGLLGSAPVFGAAWKVAGAVGGLGAVTSGAAESTIIGRAAAAAAQGGLSAWLLEGGGDQSVEEAATNVAFGAGLGLAGVALGEAIPRLAAKFQEAFPSRFNDYTPNDRRGTAFRDNTTDAEWYFEADHQLQNPNPNAPKGWLPETTGSDGSGGGLDNPSGLPSGPAPEQMDPFLAPRPNTQTTTNTPPGTSGALMSPERAAITERILSLEEHRDLARRAMETDALTGLGNKRALARVQGEVDADQSLGWAIFDGKKFKLVNDTHGHNVGDQTLINFGRAITQAAVEMNIPARIFRQGGDEFSAVVPKDQLQPFTQRVAELSYQKVGGVETWLDGYAHDTFGEADLTLMGNKRGGLSTNPMRTQAPSRENYERFGIESGAHYMPVTGEHPAFVPDAGDYAATGLVPEGADPSLVDRGFYPHSDLVANPNRFAQSYQETQPGLITPSNKPAEVTPQGVIQYSPPQIKQSPQEFTDSFMADRLAEGTYYDSTELDQALSISSSQAALNESRGLMQQLEAHRGELEPGVFNQMRWGLSLAGQTIGDQIPLSTEAQTWANRALDFLGHDPVDFPRPASGTLNTTSASLEGSNLTKQATLLNSDDLPQLANASEVTTADVARAAIKKYPASVHVIQGVDAAKTVRELTQAQLGDRLMPHNFRFVERNGRMDLLVAGQQNISNKMAKQYEKYGFFDDQSVTANGSSLIIATPEFEPGLARVYDPYTEEYYLVPHEQIMPENGTGHVKVENGEKLYGDLRSYVERYMEQEAAKMPEGSEIDTSWLSKETSSQLPRLMDAFLDARGINTPIARAAVDSDFNIRRVHDFQQLAPEELDDLQEINSVVSAERQANPVPYLPIEDIAVTKGFAYVSEPGTRGGTLVDRLSDLRVPVENEDAAYEFLRSFQREVPDYSPVSEVPPEVMGANPHAANPGDDLEPIHEDHYVGTREGMDDIAARVNGEIEAMIREVESPALDLALPQRGGGSGSGGGDFPPPTGPSLGRGRQPELPPGRRPSLGEQFQEAHLRHPRELYEVQQSLDGFLTNWFTPWRHVAAMVEHELKGIGISEGRLWAQQNAVSVAVTEAHNAALPWQVEWADIMSYFRRPLLRKGVVTKIAEIVDPAEQMAAMREAGYNDQEIVAQQRIREFNNKFFAHLVGDDRIDLDWNRYVAGYMSHIRMRQGMPGVSDPFAGGDSTLPDHMKFFAEMARTGNMQFRQMDARVLGTKMIRSAFFKIHVDPPYHEMKTAWDDPRIPTKFRELATDWLEVVRTGHQPGNDALISGVRRTVNLLGFPLDNSEVAVMMNMGFGNMYRAQLGGRPDAIFRDFLQLWFSGVRIGFNPIHGVLKDFFSGNRGLVNEITARAMDGGWLEKGMGKYANADIWEAGIQTPEGINLLSESAQNRREVMAKIGDVFWAATPKRLRNGLQGSWFDPLHGYTKLGEFLRTASGEAGYRIANKALNEYQSAIEDAGSAAVEDRPALFEAAKTKLMKDSKARAYHQVVQDEFTRLVDNGQMKEAAYLMANKAADHQFRYGAKENPIVIRKMGMTGRAIMQFGSFTNQYVGEMRDMFMAPGVHPAEKVAMGLRYGAVMAALGGAAAYTGWRFNRWQWHQSLSWSGGPIGGGLGTLAQAVTGKIATATGTPPTTAQRDAMIQWRDPVSNLVTNVGESLNPFSSTVRTAKDVLNMSQSLNPVEGTARKLITGEASMQPDIRQFLDSLGQTTVDPYNPATHPGSHIPGAGSY